MRALRGAGEAKVKVDHLSFFYDRFQALHEVTFDIPERRITAIIGPSGCGKSTLLRVFNRMYDLVPKAHASGAVLLDNENVVTSRRLLELRQKVGMVFQRPSPFPMSVRDNVAFAPKVLGLKDRPRTIEGGWRDKSENSNGVMYEQFCRKYGYRTCGPILGEHH